MEEAIHIFFRFFSSFLAFLLNPGVILCCLNLAPKENTPGLTFCSLIGHPFLVIIIWLKHYQSLYLRKQIISFATSGTRSTRLWAQGYFLWVSEDAFLVVCISLNRFHFNIDLPQITCTWWSSNFVWQTIENWDMRYMENHAYNCSRTLWIKC